ncbi:MAG TPA: hypothetical protein VL688_10255 [Verrucomicrobiae bacterium]|jgi:hypothetical protein|nr:hypothetical protein [Verrucomicrobiae bacterium]
MSKKEFVIAEVRQQRQVLGQLINRLKQKKEFDRHDSFVFEFTTKEVEKSLRLVNKIVSEELIKELYHDK